MWLVRYSFPQGACVRKIANWFARGWLCVKLDRTMSSSSAKPSHSWVCPATINRPEGEQVGVGVAVPAIVGVAVAVGVGVRQGGVVSSSTVLTTVLAVLKPSATSTRPSGSVPCAWPARLPIIAGPALNVPLLIVKMWVDVVELPLESAPSVISSCPVPNGDIAP